MPIFISYARRDRPAVEVLARDLGRTRDSVWLDNELTGGQAWWDTILREIRACDLYVFALSPESLRSRACRLELQYALAVRRPLLPVQIADLAITTAPQVIADTHIVDYRERTPEAGFALSTAVLHRPPAPELPDPLPPEPPPPMSYMNEFFEAVDASVLTYQQQNHLLVDLRGYLHDDDDRETALDLIRSLRRRRDISMSVAQEIDQLFARQEPAESSPDGPVSTPPPRSEPAPEPRPASGQPTPPPAHQRPQSQPTPPPAHQRPQSQPTPPPAYRPPQSQPTPPPAYRPPQSQPTPGYGPPPQGQPGAAGYPPPSGYPGSVPQPSTAAYYPPPQYPSATSGYQSVPGPAPAATGSPAVGQPLGTGLFVVLLMIAAFFPIGGLIAGLILLARPARRSQAAAVLVCSVVSFIIWYLLLY